MRKATVRFSTFERHYTPITPAEIMKIYRKLGNPFSSIRNGRVILEFPYNGFDRVTVIFPAK